MIQHVTRIVTRWLQHPEHGLNAILATLPMAPGDPRPAGVYVYDDVDSVEGAADEAPPSSPALLVMAYDGVAVRLESGRATQDASRPVRVVLWWLIEASETATVRHARIQSSYVWEAALESLSRLLNTRHSGYLADQPNLRQEQTMEVTGLVEAQEARAGGAVQQMQLVAALVVSLTVRRIPITRARL